jgi:hypothetical protein
LSASLLFWAILLLPITLFAVCIHLLERFIQGRLVSRFGWRSVLVTGWLGTPIHELSHVAMCYLFRHRVDEVQLFDPDVREGRLGFVRHSYHRGNWFEEAGNLFIGTAPLLGGSIVLIALTFLFFPDPLSALFQSVRETTAEKGLTVGDLPGVLSVLLGKMWSSVNPLSPRFWMYAYLITCVAAHMAPSRSDYAGAMRGTLLSTGLALVITFVAFAVFRVDHASVIRESASLLAPMLAIAGLALGLVLAAAALTAAITAIFPRQT